MVKIGPSKCLGLRRSQAAQLWRGRKTQCRKPAKQPRTNKTYECATRKKGSKTLLCDQGAKRARIRRWSAKYRFLGSPWIISTMAPTARFLA